MPLPLVAAGLRLGALIGAPGGGGSSGPARVGVDADIDTPGLRDFRRDLKRLQPLIAKELTGELRDISQPVVIRAASLAPRLTGELARSLRVSVQQRGVSIYSTLPQAPVLHWGGTIRPRGVPITFPRTEFISRAVEEHADRLLDDVSDGVERASHRAGWHR